VASPEDRSLVDRAQQGDDAAWEQLDRRTCLRLRADAAARVGPPAADDIVRETIPRPVAGIARYRAGAPPAGKDGGSTSPFLDDDTA
jgi:DNA-directed RNA polymerase specialized sigma24 family protein